MAEHIFRPSAHIFFVLLALTLGACSSLPTNTGKIPPTNIPRSILVFPPQNNTVEVNASYTFLASISKPIAEKGYYVFPVAVIDHFLKENGLPTPAEMNTIPLDKIREHIGAEAVLYTEIHDWGQKYLILTSETVVNASLTLVDTNSGAVLWRGRAHSRSSNHHSSNSSLTEMLLGAVVDQITNSFVDRTYDLSRQANKHAIRNLPSGPYRQRPSQ